jgi:ATP-dependent Clp protease adaptor protein ClpS
MWALAAAAVLFLVSIGLLVLWWIAGLFKPAEIDVRRIGADLGLIEDAVPSAEAYSIRLFNDDLTPMDFVVESLQATLKLSREHAVHLMLHVHQHGTVDIGRMQVEKARGFVDAMLAMSQKDQHSFRCEAVPHESASGMV